MVLGITDAVSVQAGQDYSCAVLANGSANCWGYNIGILGTGFPTTSAESDLLSPQPVQGIDDVHSMATGALGTCALKRDGSVWCWAQYLYTISGATQVGSKVGSNEPTKVELPYSATALSAGLLTFCVVLLDTTVRCWGFNSAGQLGDGTTVDSKAPVPVVGLHGAVDVSTNGNQTCALLSDGTVSCWGMTRANSNDAEPTLSPTSLTGLSDVVELSQSPRCARLKSGKVYCWNYERKVQVGDALLDQDGPKPVAVEGLSNAAAVASNDGTNCTRLTDGTLRCWGSNREGALGCGVQQAHGPVSVYGLGGVAQVVAGDEFGCALSRDGVVRCWGNSISTSFDKDPPADLTDPLIMDTSNNVTQISVSWGRACWLKRDGTVRCMVGSPGYSFLPTRTSVPDTTFNGKVPVQLAAGGVQPCVLLPDGTVACWNSYPDPPPNANGTVPPSREPVAVDGLSNIVAIAADIEASFALRSDGTLWSWGRNSQSGELGNGTTQESATPVQVATSGVVTSVASGLSSACAVLEGGSVQCWGSSLNPNATNDDVTSVPQTVAGLTNVTAVSVGGGFACALVGNGSVSCWGRNEVGQLGDGTFLDSPLPVQVQGISTAVSVAAGFDHCCSLLADETLRCWGSNYEGQLGNGAETGFSPMPVSVSGWQ
jgi:alpha-tubulin suppressor-like RCC1 family protein